MRIIDEDGSSLGIISRDQAIFLALDKGLDLIEINPNADPPVAKIIDYGKYQYDIQKKENKQKTRHKASELKEVRLSFKIDSHDLTTKARRAKEFLNQGDKVRVVVILRGRENIFREKAKENINRFVYLAGGKAEGQPVTLGNRINVVMTKNN